MGTYRLAVSPPHRYAEKTGEHFSALLAVFEFAALFAGISLLLAFALTSRPPLAAVEVVAQALLIALVFVVVFFCNDLYDVRVGRDLKESLPRSLQACAIAMFFTTAFHLLAPLNPLEARVFLVLQLASAVFLLCGRATCCALFRKVDFGERVLLIGDSPLSRKIASDLSRLPLGYAVSGRVLESREEIHRASGDDTTCSVLGSIEDIGSIIESQAPDRLVVTLEERRGRLPVEQLVFSCVNGIIVEDGVEFYEGITGKLAIESLRPSQLLFSKDFKKSRSQLVLKRIMSVSTSLVGLIISAPVMAIIALLIRLDSPGAVFFLQKRAGLKGKTFHLIKFRTMQEQDGEPADAVWERDLCSRVTRVGQWLRPLRLDELPQFINVLRGDMDLVGPRPEMASNIPEMTAAIPYYKLRMCVRPGLTGWAQINNGYAVTLEEVTEKLRFDLYYIKHMSISMDLRILLRTIKIMLQSRGN